MSNLIDRQAAIDALGEKPLWAETEYELGLQDQWQSDVDTLKDLPSAPSDIETGLYVDGYNDGYRDGMKDAQPKRPKGEWIPEFNGNFTCGAYWFSCSKCKRIVPEVRNGGWNYCPNCGAYMGE